MNKYVLLFTALFPALTLPLEGQTILHYRVSDGDSATVAGGSVPGAGSASGTASGTVSLSPDIPGDGVPPGAGNRSLSFGGAGGVLAPGTQQLSKQAVAAAGGFTCEAWFKYTGAGNVNSIIDYAGTEKLVRRVEAAGVSMTASGATEAFIGNAGVNEWHYAAVVFTSTGLAGTNINGTYTLYLDGNTPVSTVADVTIDATGDSLNRTIAVGMHPLGFAGDYFQGLIYEPRVTLGALTGAQLLYSSRPRIVSFTAAPENIEPGGTSTLSWEVSDAATVTITDVAGPLATATGSTSVSPAATKTYTLTATNAGGSSTLTATVSVNAVPLDPVINEFMADNAGTLEDADGDAADWIELKNPNAFRMDVSGWSLTDDPLVPKKWTLPAGAGIPAKGFLLIYASGKDRVDPAGELHANFSLDTLGEYLALVRPDGSTAGALAPAYPEQQEDAAYGLPPGGTAYRYFTTPTPGAENGAASVAGFVSDTKWAPDRGFYDTPQTVTITCATPGATIVYTTDASSPSLTNGTAVPAANSTTAPVATVAVSQTTTLRAAAFLPDHAPASIDTHTYIFLSDVVLQSPTGAAPRGWPAGAVNGQIFNYGMDPNIVNHATWGPLLKSALQQVPSLSVVTDQGNLTSATTGIYTHASNDGDTWERPASFELINPGNVPGFQVNAGLRVRGGFSRGGFNPKHSFRLFFSRDYGTANLKYRLFGQEGADEFDKIDLRTEQNYAWSNDTGNDQLHNTFIRDVFHRDSQRDAGQPYTRSRYYHLYLNGQYWGLYQTQERSESFFAKTYIGGKRADWDVVKPAGGAVSPVDGTITAYRAFHTLAVAGFATDAAYFAAQGRNPDGSANPALPVYLDVDNLIDYMLINIFCGNTDGPLDLGNTGPNNFYGIRNRTLEARDPWRFLCHDSEHSMAAASHDINTNVTTTVTAGQAPAAFNPRWLNQRLALNARYRQRFADRVQRHFFNGGILTKEKNVARWNARAAEIDLAIIAESARWGDQHNEPALSKQTWQTELNWVTGVFFERRNSVVLAQLRTAGLFPNVVAPTFNQHGGSVPAGFNAQITAPAGDIYYTTDGSDPRDGVTRASTTLLAATAPAKALIPAVNPGNTWKGGSEPFDDAAWLSGTSGTGFEARPGDAVNFTSFIGLDVGAMRNTVSSVYVRIPFNVADPAAFNELTLRMRYDDGFVAYLNGIEVASANKPSPLAWNSATRSGLSNADTAAVQFADFDITSRLGILKAGANVLAIQGLNANLSSDDLLLQPEVIGSVVGAKSGGKFYAGDIPVAAQTTLRAAVFSGGQWSALTEATFLINAVPASAANLVIPEFNYRPAEPTAAETTGGAFDRGDFEFVELQNTGTSPVDLTGVRFTDGIELQFPDHTVLQPGAYAVAVKNPAAFAARYPGVAITATFGGSLANEGETVTLTGAGGAEIRSFTYDDAAPWPASADGDGYSLVLVSPESNPDHNVAANWRISAAVNGTPGTTEGEGQSYAAWAAANGITGGPGDDDDRNGFPNLIDYVMPAQPQVKSVDGRLEIAVVQRTAASGASLILQVSGDLVTWTDLAPVAVVDNGNGTRTLSYAAPAVQGQRFGFARVKAVRK